jgi:PAS domain S-box-containing protein
MTRMDLAAERLLFALRGGNRLNGVENESTARGFHLLLTCFLFGILLYLAVAEPFFVVRKAVSALVLAGAGAIILTALHLLRTRRFLPAARVFVISVWCIAEGCSAFDGALHSGVYGLVVLTIVNAGWLLGKSSAIRLTAATLLFSLAEAMLEYSGHPVPRYFAGNPIASWMVLAGILIFAVGPILSILDSLGRAGARLLEYEKIVENLTEMILVVDRHYRYQIVNKAYLDFRRVKLGQVIGHLIPELTGQEAFEQFIKSRVDECFQGKLVKYESAVTYSELGPRDLNATCFPIQGPAGIDRIAIVLEDITDRNRAERERQRAFQELQALNARLQNVREEERTSLARELHDRLGQTLTAIRIDLAALKTSPGREEYWHRIDAVSGLVEETIQTVRRISTELRPGILDDLGLVATLEWATKEFQARTGIKCQVTLPEANPAIGAARSTVLFRIFQEALTNIARHAGATRVTVDVSQDSEYLLLEVCDNGCGIDPEQLSASGSLGILGMRERALLVGGEVAISGTSGGGTTVRVRIPFNGRANAANPSN